LEPDVQPAGGRERGQEARLVRQARARPDADGAGRQGRGEGAGGPEVTISATPPSLIDGLRPLDRSFESWWVRPGSATAVEVRAADAVTIRDPDGGQAPEVTVVPEALGLRMDAPATVLDNLPGDFLASLHASGVRPDAAGA